jgi:hypothetical protein
MYDPHVLTELDHSKYEGVILVPGSKLEELKEVQDLTEYAAASLSDALSIGVSRTDYPAEYDFLKSLLDSQEPLLYIREHLLELNVTLKPGA